MKTYRKTNAEYRFRKKISNKIRKTLQKMHLSKGGISSNIYLGCTPKELKSHLEKQFAPDMTWENYGTLWQIDHIMPCAAFDASVEDMKKCWHYTNLRPLLAVENLKKSNFVGGRRISKKRLG